MTPLMMAADVGQLELAQTLVERGARIDSADSLGRMPIQFGLRRAFRDPDFAREELGAFYELSCPTAIELEADGRRPRLARNEGEFFLLPCFVARVHERNRSARRRPGFTAQLVRRPRRHRCAGPTWCPREGGGRQRYDGGVKESVAGPAMATAAEISVNSVVELRNVSPAARAGALSHS